MLFNSFQYAVFFPAVVVAYFTLAHRHRWILLLLSSYLFYMAWEPGYVVLIWISTVVDYFAAICMAMSQAQGAQLAILTALACSFAMALPISTPPNAIAFATGKIDSHDMLRTGGVIGFVSVIVLLLGYQVMIPLVL